MDQFDGYIRLRPRERQQVRESRAPDNPDALLFIDVEGLNLNPADVQDAFRDVLQRLATTRYILLRWPRLTAASSAEEELALQLATQRLANDIGDHAVRLGLSQIWLGIVRFRVGESPIIAWAREQAPEMQEPLLLQRALRVEMRALLDWGRAVWRPAGYHFELPSGEHTATFIRVADAFRTPRDVRVLTSWLTPRLVDGLGIVADSAALIPLITDLHAAMRKRNWRPGPTEILDEYPRTRLDVLRVARRAQLADGGVLGLLSVSGSGRLRDLLLDGLSAAPELNSWSLVVLVDKDPASVDETYAAVATGTDEQRVAVWVGLDYAVEDPASDRGRGCTLCRSNERAQVVKIDPRSFETLAFPGVLPITPDVTAARQSLHFWQACDRSDAIGVEVKPATTASAVARSKGTNLAVRIDFDELLATSKVNHLADAVARRMSQLNRPAGGEPPKRSDDQPLRYNKVDGILISRDDDSPELHSTVLPMLFEGLGLRGAAVEFTEPNGAAPAIVSTWKRALTFSLGTVSGWNMRQLQLQVEHAWAGQRGHELFGLVLHARPPSEREWVSLGRSYRNQLRALWLTYLPLRSPLLEERDHLREIPRGRLSERAFQFRLDRLAYCRPRRNRTWRIRLDDYEQGRGSVDPYAIFWGSPPRGGSDRVRTESNFGFEVRGLAAYAAMGSAMHRSRQAAISDDPRRRVFEMPAISRSYYDGLLVAAVLRWCEPQEAWWGESPRMAENSLSDLIARTREPADQKVLFSELLLAASMGKVPHAAARLLEHELPTQGESWSEDDHAPMELGLALLKAARVTR